MSSELFPAIAAFARVAHYASFTRAAAELGVSPSALSQTVRTLEGRLGVRLLDRSTRRVGVTEIGQRFLSDAQLGLSALETAIDAVNESRERPVGLLRLNLSRTAAEILVLPHLIEFNEAFPDITLEMHCDNALLDLVGNGFDAGIRLGENLAQDVVAVPLGGRRRIATVAAPRYLEGRTPPRTPEDLKAHRCINVRLGGSVYRWEFSHKGRDFDIETTGPLLTNDGDVLLAAVRAGAGIACAFEVQVQDDIAAGRLVPLLKAWWPTFPGFYLYHPSRIHVSRKLRVFIDFMQQRLNPR
ncbi:LysR family transcriptional regulator [Variovorax sp. UMC13]|uniref:LysR family transcriptional regulator n=1 Tax=Variovorax sp. UMC13 TaxID=1862326 RepID=UPI00287B749B|nr:LysR family transcriptional regulator [Variovorax sp. UMC13]